MYSYFWRITTLLFLTVSPLHAHRLNVFTYTESDRIHVESYFSRGSNCMGCLVEVTNASGDIVASGTTTEDGKWSFIPTETEGLIVTVTAGEGHRAEYVLSKSDIPLKIGRNHSDERLKRRREGDAAEGSIDSIVLHREELEEIVDQALERRLAPLREEIRRIRVHEPGVTEIFGGIGYLVGICGVAMYFLSHKK